MWILWFACSTPQDVRTSPRIDVQLTGPGAGPGIAVDWRPEGGDASFVLGFTDAAGRWAGVVPGPGTLAPRHLARVPEDAPTPDSASLVTFEVESPACTLSVRTSPGARVYARWSEAAEPSWLGDADASGRLAPVPAPCARLRSGQGHVYAFGPDGWGQAPAVADVVLPTRGRTARVHGTFTWADGRAAGVPLEVGVRRRDVDPADPYPRYPFLLPQPVVDGAWSAWLPSSGGIDHAIWTSQGEGSAWFPYAPDADAPAHLVVETAQGFVP